MFLDSASPTSCGPTSAVQATKPRVWIHLLPQISVTLLREISNTIPTLSYPTANSLIPPAHSLLPVSHPSQKLHRQLWFSHAELTPMTIGLSLGMTWKRMRSFRRMRGVDDEGDPLWVRFQRNPVREL